jgi:HK97 family phage portal protein
MGLFNRKKKTEKREIFPTTYSNTYYPGLFSKETNPTVKSCINKIARTFSTLTPILYKDTKNGRARDTQSDLYHLLMNPSYEETSALFWDAFIRSMLEEGNGYIYLGRYNGRIADMKVVNPYEVKVTRNSSHEKIFTIRGIDYTEYDILHFPMLGEGYDGTRGVSPMDRYRELINLGSYLYDYINNYFHNNSPGDRLSIELGTSYPSRPADMDKLYAQIMPVLNKFVLGAKNAGKPMINIPDSKTTVLDQSSNVQAQLSEVMEMVERTICLLCFSMPYEMINTSVNKYDSLETLQQEYLTSCIQPLGNHICQTLDKLLPSRVNHHFRYDYKTLLTTNTKDTVDYLVKEFNNGAISMNEMRAKLGMDGIGPEGDYHFVQSNLMPLTMDNIKAYMAKNKAELEALEHNPQGDDKS